jgi:mono/diheme cytochrome c family protein
MAAVTHWETYSLCRYRLAAVRRLALLAVLGALVAGCGGEKTVQPVPETVEGTVPQAQPPTPAKGNPTAGKQVFTQSGCGGCHTFKPAGSTGTTGPDLDKLAQYAQTAGKPLDEFVHESIQSPDAYVEKGFPSGVMPAWSGDETQLNDLVAFLTKSS